ncbi:hypothetical protein L7F22_064550 [Adiantum nelumboides]|nr:hypothetical protein [Adiantum nelumboides]
MELFENMGTTLKFSSSFHPQTDGQSEEGSSTVLDLLKCYVSEDKAKWEEYLPLVDYGYNNTVHSSTGKAPFEIVEGGKKNFPILHTKDKIFEADKYVQDMDEMYKKVKIALEKTQAKQKKAIDRHRREVVFSLGDWVLLRFEKARLKKMKGKERLFPKLSMHYYGSFQVCDKISDVAYRLKLPKNWKIHNAFHVKSYGKLAYLLCIVYAQEVMSCAPYTGSHVLQVSKDGFVTRPSYMDTRLSQGLRCAIGQIRTSSHQLEIEFGRFQGIPPEDRLYKLCGTEPETELHYIDMSILRVMKEEELKELGIPMGPRKKISLALAAQSKH